MAASHAPFLIGFLCTPLDNINSNFLCMMVFISIINRGNQFVIKEIQQSFLLQFFYFFIAGGGMFYLVMSFKGKGPKLNKRLFLFSLAFGAAMWFVFSIYIFEN